MKASPESEVKENSLKNIVINQIEVNRGSIIKTPFIRAKGATHFRRKTSCHLFLHLLSSINNFNYLIIRARYLKISPSKIQPIVTLVRKEGKKGIDHSLNLLRFLPHKGAKIIYKILKGAKKQFLNQKEIKK